MWCVADNHNHMCHIRAKGFLGSTFNKQLLTHLCYKTDFLFAKSGGPEITYVYYSEYSMNILCKYEKKISARCLFICVFRKYMFCVQLYGKWFQTSLPLATLPLCHVIIACCFRVAALSSNAALALSPSGIAPELKRIQLSAICRGGQSGKVIDLLAWRCLPLGHPSAANGTCAVVQISSSMRRAAVQSESSIIFFWFLQKMSCYYLWTCWSPWGPQPQNIKVHFPHVIIWGLTKYQIFMILPQIDFTYSPIVWFF